MFNPVGSIQRSLSPWFTKSWTGTPWQNDWKLKPYNWSSENRIRALDVCSEFILCVLLKVLRIECPIFLFYPRLSHCMLPLSWLHNCSRLYSLLSDEKRNFCLLWDPFSDNDRLCFQSVRKSGRDGENERGRGEGGERERWRLSSKVGLVTVWPCGPQSEGWREEQEG